ncbi:PAS and ANTAR domain-containing protein (plasmid) [Rhodococcus qingshengii]|uniref:PAS and ANTAR domain-containing protein n=1 Tax=Rhodococcus qingshengii TaxID=334542 RepID=UPI00211380E0|nr:PAS and ANTAR domain-containing protein [Rhodococcus qingshengii]UUE28795.1 PAS and ANTAR domain-containing protein [Rhodococcus qingshengii]
MTNGRMERVSESGAPHRVGGFRYSRTDDEWEWSDNVATMHGYHPGEVVPTTELLLSHKHPDDRHYVSQTLDAIRTSGGPFSSRHRIIDTHGVTRSVIVVGDSIEDEHGEVTGSAGFYIDVTETLDHTVKETVDELVDEISSSRAAIEQAKGMLMIVYGIPPERAFDILIWCSQQQNVKLRRIAEQLIARARTDFVLPGGLRSQFDHVLLCSAETDPQ